MFYFFYCKWLCRIHMFYVFDFCEVGQWYKEMGVQRIFLLVATQPKQFILSGATFSNSDVEVHKKTLNLLTCNFWFKRMGLETFPSFWTLSILNPYSNFHHSYDCNMVVCISNPHYTLITPHYTLQRQFWNQTCPEGAHISVFEKYTIKL